MSHGNDDLWFRMLWQFCKRGLVAASAELHKLVPPDANVKHPFTMMCERVGAIRVNSYLNALS